VFALQDTMQGKQNNLNGILDQKNEKQVTIAKLETKQEDLENEAYQELHESLPNLSKRVKNLLEIAELEKAQEQIQKLKYKLSLIGGIDEEVVEEYKETKYRHDGLSTELTDLGKAIDDLETLIEELDGIMKKRRGKAFKEIRKEFSRYFKLLFEGGKADLIEVFGNEEDEELSEEAEEEVVKVRKKGKKILKGVDITASPPGKKINNIQVLSGGERTMTAIALICAILHTNPSPFVVLDEVEAALDEANSVRLTRILRELSEHSQFILITHNRATMHAADALYGVTMGNDGISRLLSVDIAEAEKEDK
jgi:chromosome segregation protein